MQNKSLNILIIQPWLSWRGAERTSIQQAIYFTKLGVRAKIAALYIDKRNLPFGAEEIDYLLPSSTVQRFCQKNAIFLFLIGPIILFLLVLKESKSINLLNPHNLPSPWIAVVVGKLRKIPVVWTVHNLPQKVSWKKKSSVFEYFLWLVGASWFDKFFIRRIDLLLVSSERMKRQIKKWYGLNSKVIIHGIDYSFYSKGRAKRAMKKWKLADKFVLLSARQIHPEKNQIALIKGLPKLIEKIPNVFLVLAGEGSAKKECEEEAERLKVSDRVLFTGLVSRKDLSDLYAAADINLMPSFEEPLGLTPFEALAGQTISIISQNSGAAEVVKNQDIAVICKPTINDINKKILDIYFNQDKYGKKAQKGSLWVKKNLSSTSFAKTTLEAMKSVVRERSSLRSLPSKLYNRKYFLTQCGGFEEFLEGGINSKLLFAYNLASIKKGDKVLDIGTGRGELTIKCARVGASVVAIDYSKASIKLANNNLKKQGKLVSARITYKLMNAKKLSFAEKSFDVVFMIDVVEHLYPEELRQSFSEIKRVLKPSGRLIIHTPNAWLIKPLYFLAIALFKWEKQDVQVHVNEQSFFGLYRNFRMFGGKVKIFFKQRRGYFSGALHNVRSLPSWTTRLALASFLDKIFENKVVSFCVYNTPLVLFLGSDLWAVVETSSAD